MKDTVNKLYNFIARFLIVLEGELDEIKINDINIKSKKEITVILNKLVILIIHLNKLKKEESIDFEESMPSEDKQIIDQFLVKYKN